MALPEQQIEQLVIDTFSLWDVRRVGFSWRRYYLDHTRQVRALALRLGTALEADVRQLRLAAILHDISKRYDGAIRKDGEGRTLVDEEGLWLNETVRPDRANWVTQMYDRLGLQGRVHHLSGAVLTEHVLRDCGYPASDARAIGKIVRGHLKGSVPPAVHAERYREVEVRILYDADTIDPNVGLPALYRNVQIHAGAALARGEPVELAAYVRGLSRWLDAKEGFREHMLTPAGREVCEDRQTHLRSLGRELEAELEAEPLHRRFGLLGVLEQLFTDPEDPSLHEHAERLRSRWLPERRTELAAASRSARERGAEALERSERFITRLHAEMVGEA